MFGDSPFALALIWSVLILLCALFSLRGWALLRRKGFRYSTGLVRRFRRESSFRDLLEVRDPLPSNLSLASLAAALFGVMAIISLGVVFPLRTIDAVFGGSNVVNLIQSLLTVCAFWSFRGAVRAFVNASYRAYRTRLLAALLIAIAIPFFMITDRGPTSARFMSEHASQLADVIYNVLYMSVLAWIVVDMVWALRGSARVSARGIYTVFSAGLTLVLLSCVDEILYICIAHFEQSWVAEITYYAFYVLFFSGILVVAAGWTWVILIERDYVGALIWRVRATSLALLLLRVRKAAKCAPAAGHRETFLPPPSTPRASERHRPRLRVSRYIAPRATLPTLTVIPAETLRETAKTILGASSEDVAYRFVVQIRNTANRHGVEIAERDEHRLMRIETLFPGLVLGN